MALGLLLHAFVGIDQQDRGIGAGRTGERDHDVGHGHVDLRLFLAWRDQHGEKAEQQGHQGQQRRDGVGEFYRWFDNSELRFN